MLASPVLQLVTLNTDAMAKKGGMRCDAPTLEWGNSCEALARTRILRRAGTVIQQAHTKFTHNHTIAHV